MRIAKKTLQYLLVAALLIFTTYPFIYMISTSFKSMGDFFVNPFSIFGSSATLEQYFSVFDMGLPRYFLNSIIITTVSVTIVVFVSALASYPLSRMKFKFNRPLFLLFTTGMMIPIHATLIPNFIMASDLGIYDSLWALLGPYVAFAIPISVFIFTQFMSEIPKELEEAAQIDGASHWTIFSKVMFPNIKPAISTVVIYNFVYIWNEFIFALILTQSRSSQTLPVGLQNFYGEFSVNVPGLMAALTLASVPVIIVFVFTQERVVKGLIGGAVKG